MLTYRREVGEVYESLGAGAGQIKGLGLIIQVPNPRVLLFNGKCLKAFNNLNIMIL